MARPGSSENGSKNSRYSFGHASVEEELWIMDPQVLAESELDHQETPRTAITVISEDQELMDGNEMATTSRSGEGVSPSRRRQIPLQKLPSTESSVDSPRIQSRSPLHSPTKGAGKNKSNPGILPKSSSFGLSDLERTYLLSVERGDMASVRAFLAQSKADSTLNPSCVDPLGRSALLIAIENENVEMIRLLLEHHVETGDALLYAINEENVEAVETLLKYLDDMGKFNIESQGVEISERSAFTPDMTPIILAAHRDNYEIINLLHHKRASVHHPHDVQCACSHCLEELSKKCQNFAVDLLDQVRGSAELEIVLNHDTSDRVVCRERIEQHERMQLARLKLAIQLGQKRFVAHPNCQQLLASMWYEGLPGFRRKNMVFKVLTQPP